MTEPAALRDSLATLMSSLGLRKKSTTRSRQLTPTHLIRPWSILEQRELYMRAVFWSRSNSEPPSLMCCSEMASSERGDVVLISRCCESKGHAQSRALLRRAVGLLITSSSSQWQSKFGRSVYGGPCVHMKSLLDFVLC